MAWEDQEWYEKNGVLLATIMVPEDAESGDPTLCLPYEIAVWKDGPVVALHPDEGDFAYDGMWEFCDAYKLDQEEVNSWHLQ